MNLSYEQGLQVVASIILESDAHACDALLCEEELGLGATLKPHQVEGVSWLIRRFKLGVNVVLGDDLLEKQLLKERLAMEFEINDLRKLKYFVGIEVAYLVQSIFVYQRKYIPDLLKEIGKLGCKAIGVPIEQDLEIGSEEESPRVDKA